MIARCMFAPFQRDARRIAIDTPRAKVPLVFPVLRLAARVNDDAVRPKFRVNNRCSFRPCLAVANFFLAHEATFRIAFDNPAPVGCQSAQRAYIIRELFRRFRFELL